MNGKTNPVKALAAGAAVVIIALTGAAFWLSYAHLAEVALSHGLKNSPTRAWAWPATLDLFIVAGELLMLRAAIARKVDPWAIGLTAVGSLGSIALNVAGVTGTRDPSTVPLLDYVVAAVPPTAALLAFGALMRQVHQALAELSQGAEMTAPATAPVTIERTDIEPPTGQVAPLQLVTPPVIELPARSPMWHDWSASKVTTAVPAQSTRQVVTEVVTRTPADLRRDARKLHRKVVAETNRPVTIDRLREEFGLSRREAADLRREVVAEVAS